MCKICVDYNKGLMTLDEAWRNLHENPPWDDDHAEALLARLVRDKYGRFYSEEEEKDSRLEEYGDLD